MAKYPGSQLTDGPKAPVPTALYPVPLSGSPTNVDLYMKADKFDDVFLSDRVDAARANELAATQRPANLATNIEPTKAVAWKTIPSWFLVATDDRTIGTQNLRFIAKRAGSTTVEVNAPHDVMETNSDDVTALILQAAHDSKPSFASTGGGAQTAVLGGAAAVAIGSDTFLVVRSRRARRSA
ncbi:alpha/beta hydrolase [Streptomyces sp900105755]|uniref:alpha/beta fold hydrolase n=1 Tax=Streptomyces sp. 900105755 TaxID=3154389 RepID=UPI00333259BD